MKRKILLSYVNLCVLSQTFPYYNTLQKKYIKNFSFFAEFLLSAFFQKNFYFVLDIYSDIPYNTSCCSTLGYRQMVRQRTLTPSFSRFESL